MPVGRARISRHAQNHLPGGSDPLPTCCPQITICVPLAERILSVADLHPGGLIGYWKLDEAAEPFADSSGQALPADMAIVSGGTDLTPDVLGLLPVDQDVGALQFNANDGLSDYLHSASGDASRFNLSSSDLTITALVKPSTSSNFFTGAILGHFFGAFAFGEGYALRVIWPTREAEFVRMASGGSPAKEIFGPALSSTDVTLVVARYSAANGHELFYNGTLVASDAATFGGIGTPNSDPYIGRPGTGGSNLEAFYGLLGHVSLWNLALTDDEITSIYASSQPCTAGAAEDGQVITWDTDHTVWAFPTVKVDGTRYDEILSGTGISSTDNTDGTVTLDAAGNAPADDTAVWMPLTTTVSGDDVLVFDDDHSLIPTLVPF